MRAVAFAICAGAVAFVLALAATIPHAVTSQAIGRALILAIVCGVMCWAAAQRALALTADAIDKAIERLSSAAHGDLEGDVPGEVSAHVPMLATAMRGLFRQLHVNLESVQRLAMYDSVTSLPNRTHFRRAADQALAVARPGDAAVLYFIDLDRFKSVNDTLGHAAGDLLLGLVAGRLRAVAEASAGEGGLPLLGRLAGDEFTMFFPTLPDADAADRIGRQLVSALSEPFKVIDQDVAIGASVGIARGGAGTSLHDLMRAADAAMYHAKALGRGRAEVFTDLLASQIADRAQLESDLRSAIEQEQFALVFQPQVSARDGRIVGAEALLRWQHPDGVKLPGAFLRRAEESGLIVEIGEWVVNEVSATISRWGALGLDQRLAVNISVREIDHASFFRRLRDAMHAAKAPASLLELEISEALAMHCSADVLDAIAALRADGASVAIDDFGSGFTSLPRLRGLPIDRVKLDPSVVERVAEEAGARTIAQAMIALIHGLDLEVVAEGIESDAQAAVLRVIGCDVLQGYALAQPMPEAAFLDWVRAIEPQRLVS